MFREHSSTQHWGTAALVATYAVIYFTQHRRFTTIKQKSCLLPAISSGLMSALSLYFVWVWVIGTSSRAEQGYFRWDRLLEGDVDRVGRFGTVLFRAYLIGESVASLTLGHRSDPRVWLS